MNQEVPVKKKRYGLALILVLVAIGFISTTRSNIISQGGTDAISATILVAINALLVLSSITLIVLWLTDKTLSRKILPGESSKWKLRLPNVRNTLITTVIVLLILASLVFIFSKIEVNPLSLFATKEGCAEAIIAGYASKLQPDDSLAINSKGGRLPDREIMYLSGMEYTDIIDLVRQAPLTKLSDIVEFPINPKNPEIIERIVKTGKCDPPPFICYKNDSCDS